ncbi:MAG: hypothetical protein F6K62_25885 [Sphaerospermopsis sp. SIO1G2]|nr:hypothetical protein [Sphaerospermopsis sp. SIO1G1]NET74229.1 hypothetical protein [Sphaerospermopsis sp. SIO1G2]
MQPSIIVKLAIVCLLSLGGFSISSLSFLMTKNARQDQQLKIITDISRYQEIRHYKWANKTQISHFPAHLLHTTKPIMAYSPGGRQNSRFLQIRLQQSPEQIKQLLHHYQKIAKHQYQGGDTNDHLQQPHGVATTFFHTSQSYTEAFPSTYQIFVLKAQPQGRPGFKWYRGSSYGVAINSISAEIVYWAEEW